jgi:thermostable 8-oxoguanine DNA glycosylase
MPNAAQLKTYEFIRSEISRLRGVQSHTPLSLNQVSPLADDGEIAIFQVNGARVAIKPSGKVSDTGLPDCPTYASGLLPQYFLPAIAADLLSRGNPHKPFLHSQSHTPESFVAYMQHGTVLAASQRRSSKKVTTRTCNSSATRDPYNFALQFLPSEIHALVARRLTNVKEEAAMEAGGNIGRGDFSRGNLNVIVRWKMEGVHLNRVMSYVDLNTDTEISSALSAAITARTEADAIEILDKLHGVGVPVASAIMTTINPEKYTIIDIYALRSLGISDAPTDRVEYYVAYLEKCRELAQEFEVSLRTLDHALWQWGYEH